MKCEICGREVSYCEFCGKEFKLNDNILCNYYDDYYSEKHFCSLVCALKLKKSKVIKEAYRKRMFDDERKQ